ncbi:unnamed protein product [Somion occarium]|uniref:Uncharacterized protein n=1 Tax=Somion occarium TaxID=3059160 RepID=A0ABP1EBH2_9APHY
MVVSGKSPPPLCRDIVLQAMQYYVDGYLSPKELDCEDVVFNENFPWIRQRAQMYEAFLLSLSSQWDAISSAVQIVNAVFQFRFRRETPESVSQRQRSFKHGTTYECPSAEQSAFDSDKFPTQLCLDFLNSASIAFATKVDLVAQGSGPSPETPGVARGRSPCVSQYSFLLSLVVLQVISSFHRFFLLTFPTPGPSWYLCHGDSCGISTSRRSRRYVSVFPDTTYQIYGLIVSPPSVTRLLLVHRSDMRPHVPGLPPPPILQYRLGYPALFQQLPKNNVGGSIQPAHLPVHIPSVASLPTSGSPTNSSRQVFSARRGIAQAFSHLAGRRMYFVGDVCVHVVWAVRYLGHMAGYLLCGAFLIQSTLNTLKGYSRYHACCMRQSGCIGVTRCVLSCRPACRRSKIANEHAACQALFSAHPNLQDFLLNPIGALLIYCERQRLIPP